MPVWTKNASSSRHGSVDGNLKVSWKEVNTFRLSRHHLLKREPPGIVASVIGSMGGAQAQLLTAAQMSVWARVGGVKPSSLDSALWRDRTLTRAWCMRRTMFLVPSYDLALFVRGTALRAEREIRWVLGKGVPRAMLEKLVEAVLMALDEPTTQAALAAKLSKSSGYRVRYGGGRGRLGEQEEGPLGGLRRPCPPRELPPSSRGSQGGLLFGAEQRQRIHIRPGRRVGSKLGGHSARSGREGAARQISEGIRPLNSI